MNSKPFRPSPDALLNPRCDAIFKTLFTDNSEEGQLARKSFLEATLGSEVSDIKLVQNELPIESEHDKQAVFDITCLLNGTNAANIEMQGINVNNAYDKRAEYQAAHLLNHTVTKGLDWENMPEVFQISVLNFIYDKEMSDGVLVYTMKTAEGRTLSNRMTIIFIELPKYKDESKSVENLTAVEKWCKFLLYADDGTRQDLVKDLCKSDGGIMAASGILAKISQDDINWVQQTNRDMWERDQLSLKRSRERAEHARQEAECARQEAERAQQEAEEELQKAKKKLEEKEKEAAESKAALVEKDARILELLAKLENRQPSDAL